MSSPAPFILARSIAARRRSLADRLDVALGLSAGAVGTSGLAHAGDADAPRTPHTLLLPEHYKIFEGGTAVFALESGEQLSLTSDQYVLLDGGLLLVVDELVQNTMAKLPVRGSLRTQLLTEVEPVRNQDGNIVEVSSTQPLWSGDVSQPGLFEEIDLQTYELAQNTGSDAADVASSLDDSGGLSLLAGASLLALSAGLFGLLPREDEDDGSSTGGGTAANQPPTITSGGTATAAENQVTTSYTPTATDPENDSVSFSIIGGADADKFELVGGALKFKQAPDFETPGSADNDNVYEVQIQASDGNGGTATQSVSVTVTNLSDNGLRGLKIVGIDANDQLGFQLSALGDFDGDDLPDLAVGRRTERTAPESSKDEGQAFVIFGASLASDADGEIQLTDEFFDGNYGVQITGINQGDAFGMAMTATPDMTGDGKRDLFLGAEWSEFSKQNQGEAYFISSENIASATNGKIDLSDSSFDTAGLFRFLGINAEDRLANEAGGVSYIGDLNQDGLPELVATAAAANGELYLILSDFLSANSGSTQLTDGYFDGVSGIRIIGIEPGDNFGTSPHSIGDLDGDGLDELLVGAMSGNNADNRGETYVIYSSALIASNGGVIQLTEAYFDGVTGVRILGIDNNSGRGDESGRNIINIGDLNGDGKEEVVTSAVYADDGSTWQGEVYVVFSSAITSDPDGQIQLTEALLDGTNGVRIVGIASNDRIGDELTTINDMDGDGREELVIGARWAGSSSEGETYILYSSAMISDQDGEIRLSSEFFDGINGIRILGMPGDRAGEALEALDDLDGDGFEELVVGAWIAEDGSTDEGVAYVLYSSALFDINSHLTPGTIQLSDDWF